MPADTDLQLPSRPDDFDAYWGAVLDELERLPPAVETDTIPMRSNEFCTTYGLHFTGIGPYRLFAYLSVPAGDGPFPTLLYLSRYQSTVEVLPQGDADEKRGRFAVMTLAARGQRNADRPWRASFPGLLTEGIDDARTYVFRGIVADCCRAMDVALAHPQIDNGRLALLCSNDLPILTAALRPQAYASLVATPGILYNALNRAALTGDYPLEELNDYLRLYPNRREQVARTLAYFDPLFFAPQVTATCLLWGRGLEPLGGALAGDTEVRQTENSRYKDGLVQEHYLTRHFGFDEPILPARWR